MEDRAATNWHQIPIDQIRCELQTDYGRGLSSDQVTESRRRFGFNRIQENAGQASSPC